MAPEDKAAVLQPWLADPLKSPASSNVAKHVLLEHQLQSDAIAAGQAVSEPVKPAQQTNGSIDQSSTSVSEITLPPPPPLLPLQPPDAASLLPIPGQFPASRPGSSGKRRGSSESGSDDEDEATMSKKELRMRRNRESAARSRKRKRDEVEALSGRVQKLTEENTEQRKLIDSLRQKLEAYKERFGTLEEGKA